MGATLPSASADVTGDQRSRPEASPPSEGSLPPQGSSPRPRSRGRVPWWLALVLVAVALFVGTVIGDAAGRSDDDVYTLVRSQEELEAATDRIAELEVDARLGYPPVSQPPTTPATVAPPDEPEGPGTRAEPLAVGRSGRVGDWEVTVVGIDWDAASTIRAANQYFYLPPVAGSQYVMVTLSARYVGSASSATPDLTITAVGETNVVYDSSDWCGAVPRALDFTQRALPGGVLEGNECWAVRTRDLDDLVVGITPLYEPDEGPLWFAVPDGGRPA